MFQYVRIRHQYGEDVASRGAGLASNSGCGNLKIIASDVRMYVCLYMCVCVCVCVRACLCTHMSVLILFDSAHLFGSVWSAMSQPSLNT